MHRTMLRAFQAVTLALAGIASVSASAQSTDRQHPQPIAHRSFRQAGEGQKVTHYYSFEAGPGIVRITTVMRARESASNVDFELFDAGGSKLLYEYMNATGQTEQKTHALTLRRKQTLLLSVTPDAKAAFYAITLDGAVEIGEPKPEAEAEPDAEMPAPAAVPVAAARKGLSGVLVLDLVDGTRKQIDLATVAGMTIRP
jgi:hypothetical protein